MIVKVFDASFWGFAFLVDGIYCQFLWYWISVLSCALVFYIWLLQNYSAQCKLEFRIEYTAGNYLQAENLLLFYSAGLQNLNAWMSVEGGDKSLLSTIELNLNLGF